MELSYDIAELGPASDCSMIDLVADLRDRAGDRISMTALGAIKARLAVSPI
jgi:hypothetical protein